MPASTTAHKKMSAFEGLSRALVTGALVTTFTISPVLGGLQAAYADDASDTAKDETVYVKTGADGTVDGVYVVNLFDLDQGGTVTDPGTYESVQNLSTGQALSCKGGSVSLDVPAKTPTYYQGNLSSATALPWNISVTYKLDGKKVSADELAGKSGKLTIQLTVDGQSDATDANLSGFANSCVVQAQGTFDESTFKLEDAGSATVAHQGNSTVVSALVIPGEDATVTLTGEARDFEYSGWQIVAMPFSMSLDLASQADGLTDQFQPLTDATAQLSDGSNFLASALGQIAAGAASLDAGAQDALAGATQLADGASTLTAGAKAAAAGTAQLADGAVSAAAGAAGVSGGAAQVSQGLSQLSAQNSQISAGATSLAEALTTAQGSASTLAQGAQAYASGVHTAYEGVQGSSAALANTQATYAQAMAALTSALQSGDVAAAASAAQSVDAAAQAMAQASGAAGAESALAGLVDGADQLSAGAAQLSGGLDQIAGSASTLTSGLDSYLGATSTLAGGANQVASGASQLADGTAAVAAGAASAGTGASQLTAGATQFTSGATSLASGLTALASGTSTLASGATAANAGATELASGAESLADATANLGDEVLDKIQSAIDEKLGSGFTVHSFVSPDNTNVGRIQFAYVVDGVTVPSDDTEPATTDAEQPSLLDRFLALFKE